ncbi:MAG TPA: hypothetical protein VGA36_03200 [Nitriliruptorales bacterium]
MAAWIVPGDVTAVYADDVPTVEFIAHVQGLATIEIGTQSTVGDGLKAAMVEIVHRMWAAVTADPNVAQESLGSWSQTRRSGLGLTDTEKKLLAKAVGTNSMHVVPTTRGDDTFVDVLSRRGAGTLVPDASGGDPIPWIADGD